MEKNKVVTALKEKAKWTVMIYLAGDNNLSLAGYKDLSEMRAIGSTDDVNIVTEFDNAGNQGTIRYHIQRNGLNEHVSHIGETDSGDPDVLINFIKWAVESYPAERYALVLWNHGGGWEPDDIARVASSVKAIDLIEREANVRSRSSLGRAFFRTTLEDIFSLPTPAERAICSDDGSSHSLDTVELGNVLSKAEAILDQPLDLLGMDACLMSNLEVAYQAQPYVKFIVASEETEPNNGWPYDAILHEFVTKPDLPTPDLATKIVNAYVSSYEKLGYIGDVTQAALDLSKIYALTKPLDDLAMALTEKMDKATKFGFTEAMFRTKAKFYNNTLWDVANICENLATTEEVDDSIRQTAQKVRDALKSNNDSFVIAESHKGAKVENCKGVTIYIPPRVLHGISRYYKDLAYAKDHRWLAMLEAYHS